MKKVGRKVKKVEVIDLSSNSLDEGVEFKFKSRTKWVYRVSHQIK